jgi:hypothetical protein
VGRQCNCRPNCGNRIMIKAPPILFAIVALCPLCLLAAPAEQDVAARVRCWREDIAYFARELPARHKEFYALIPKNKFDRAVVELNRGIPQLSDSEIILRLMRLMASLGVGHTHFQLPSGTEKYAFQVYPVRMQWFSDGWAVVTVPREDRDALGSRVVRIGSMKPEQVEAALATYISCENKTALRIRIPQYMKYVELMQDAGLSNADGHLQLTCAKSDGKELTLDIAPLTPGEAKPKLLTATRAFHIPTPFCHKQPRAFYWYEYLPDKRTLYIQYNKCLDEPGNPFKDFVQKLFAFADLQTIDRVIIDLRFNGGGSSGIVKPLIDGLRSRPMLNARGHLYTLISGHTYSSAMFAAVALHNDLHAILVGEPTGNKPNHYGQVSSFELPNSKLKVQYSTKHFYLIHNADPPSLNPDIYVLCSLEDYLAGRDPVLDAALRRPLKQERR